MADCNDCRELPPECPAVSPGQTKCNRDRVNNVWIEGPDPATGEGVCLLDTMSECQVIYVLERDERARADLIRVTDDARLQELARIIRRLSTVETSDAEMKGQNSYCPFYSAFKGQPPFAQ